MPKKKTIKTTGHAASSFRPELVRLTLTLFGRDADMAAASEKLCRSVEAAVDRLEKSGYKREDISGGAFLAEAPDTVSCPISLCFRYSLGKLRGLLQTIGVSMTDCNVRVEALLNDPAAKLCEVKELAIENARSRAEELTGGEYEIGKLRLVTGVNIGQPAPVLVCDAPSECFRHGSIPFGIGDYNVHIAADVECIWSCK